MILQPILSVKKLTIFLKIDGTKVAVVEDLNFDLKRGKTLALVGESGCGKSMTALSILRILPTPPALPPQGSIFYENQDLFLLPEKKMQKIRGKKIAMIFQDPMSALNPLYPIGEQILEVIKAHLNLEGSPAKEKVIASFEDVHLPHPETLFLKFPHQLSGGMLQRVMIAMTLVCEPDILIADEPTTALDVTIQAQILSLLKELQEKTGMAILLITHDMGVVAELADDVLVMYAGEQAEYASVQGLFNDPAHPYTKALFACRLHHSNKRGKLPALLGHVPKLGKMPEGCRFHPRCSQAMPQCKSVQKVPRYMQKDSLSLHQTNCLLYENDLKWKMCDEADSGSK